VVASSLWLVVPSICFIRGYMSCFLSYPLLTTDYMLYFQNIKQSSLPDRGRELKGGGEKTHIAMSLGGFGGLLGLP